MLAFQWRALIVGIVLVILLFICLMLYFVGYKNANEWNNNAEETQCKVIQHKIINQQCSHSCNCVTVCSTGSDGKRTCYQSCQTCYYTCYGGNIVVSYLETYTHEFNVYSYYSFQSEVTNSLNANYPINSNILCYYNVNNPGDVRLKMEDALGFYIATLVMGIIGLIILAVWLSLELRYLLKRKGVI